MTEKTDLRAAAFDCLLLCDPQAKVEQTQQLYQQWQQGGCYISTRQFAMPDVAGYPDKPVLVAPRELPRRRNLTDPHEIL